MTKQRYTPSGEYYIQDNILYKKISNQDTIHILNQQEEILNKQEKIIKEKTETINELLDMQQYYKEKIHQLEKDVEYYMNKTL